MLGVPAAELAGQVEIVGDQVGIGLKAADQRPVPAAEPALVLGQRIVERRHDRARGQRRAPAGGVGRLGAAVLARAGVLRPHARRVRPCAGRAWARRAPRPGRRRSAGARCPTAPGSACPWRGRSG